MTHKHSICIVLAASMAIAPYAALAQGQSGQPDAPAIVHDIGHDNSGPGETIPAYVHQSHADVRVADHYARLDDSRAEAAWKRGDRVAACRWARAAQKAAGLHRADFAYRVDEYCAQDDGRAN